MRLKDVASFEPECNNWINIRLEKGSGVENTQGSYGCPEGWKGVVSNHGYLVFDFVTGIKKAPEGAEAIPDEALKEFLTMQVRPDGQHHFCLSCFSVVFAEMVLHHTCKAHLLAARQFMIKSPHSFYIFLTDDSNTAAITHAQQCGPILGTFNIVSLYIGLSCFRLLP